MLQLDSILKILALRPFTDEERIKYKVHHLHNDRKYQNCDELHIGGRNSDWLLIYHVSGNTIYFDDTIVELENTGTHSDCFGECEFDDSMEIIWL